MRGINDRFLDIRMRANYLQFSCDFRSHGADTTMRIGYRHAGKRANKPAKYEHSQPVDILIPVLNQVFLQEARANHQVSFVIEHGLDKARYFARVTLPVRVATNDYIRLMTHSRLETNIHCMAQAFIAAIDNYRPGCARQTSSAIG